MLSIKLQQKSPIIYWQLQSTSFCHHVNITTHIQSVSSMNPVKVNIFHVQTTNAHVHKYNTVMPQDNMDGRFINRNEFCKWLICSNGGKTVLITST